MRRKKIKSKFFDFLVWEKITEIPEGRVTTYKELARALGKPRAARAAGNALNRNPDAPRRPCHRVVRSGGGIGGYAGGLALKLKLLKKEGVKIKNGKIINFRERFYGF